jgi:hypothetical protein
MFRLLSLTLPPVTAAIPQGQPSPTVKPKDNKGGRKRGQVTDETQDLILLAAALEFSGLTTTYAMAPRLYSLSDRRSRDAAESATRLFRKRNRQKINDTREKLDVARAAEIVARICPKS